MRPRFFCSLIFAELPACARRITLICIMRQLLAVALIGFSTLAYSQAAATPSTTPKPGEARQTPQSLAAQVPTPAPDDVKSPEALLAACYSVISGPAGPRNWDRFRSLFAPGGRLTTSSQKPDGSHVIVLLTVDDYVNLAGGKMQSTGFFENSIHNDIRTYGNIAQIFSSYESRHAPADAEPFQRGINSFQMFYDGSRWWIISILWDDERKDNPIPPAFSHK